MAMSQRAIIALFFLAGCTKGPDADLQYIKQARTLAAEWAMINEQSNRGSLTDTYVRSMHYWLLDGLRKAHSSLVQPHSAYGDELQSILAEPPDAAPTRLRAHAEALKQIEQKIESA